MQTTNPPPYFLPTQPSRSSMHRGRRHSTRPILPSQDSIQDTTVESDQNACMGSPKSATCGPNSQVSPIAITIHTLSLLLNPLPSLCSQPRPGMSPSCPRSLIPLLPHELLVHVIVEADLLDREDSRHQYPIVTLYEPASDWDTSMRRSAGWKFQAMLVCKLWYQFVTSTPQLWNQVLLDTRTDLQLLLQRWDMTLQRTRSTSLYVSIANITHMPFTTHFRGASAVKREFFEGVSNTELECRSRTLLSEVSKQSTRIRQLAIAVTEPSSHLLSSWTGELSSLDLLSIETIVTSWSPGRSNIPRTFFQRVTTPATLRLCGDTFLPPSEQYDATSTFSFKHLDMRLFNKKGAVLDTTDLEAAQCFLHACTALETMMTASTFGHCDNLTRAPLQSFACLTSLTIQYNMWLFDNFMQFADLPLFPTLTSCTIRLLNRNKLLMPSALMMIDTHCPRLEELTIGLRGSGIHDVVLDPAEQSMHVPLPILRFKCPLRHLTFECIPIFHFLLGMCQSPTKILPNLTSLVLIHCSHLSTTEIDFLKEGKPDLTIGWVDCQPTPPMQWSASGRHSDLDSRVEID